MQEAPMDHYRFYSDVAWRLFDMAMDAGCETRPSPDGALPIDMFLDDWTARDLAPRLDPRARAYFTHVGGSFHGWVRSYLSLAFQGVARLDPSKRTLNSRKLQTFRSDSQLLSETIQAFRRKHCPDSAFSYMLDEQPLDAKTAYRFFMTALDEDLGELTNKLASLVGAIDERLEEIAPVEGGRPQQRWKRYFVGAMARAWLLLTGSLPSANFHGRLAEFVDCAWHSGGEMPSVSWDQAIRVLSSCIAEYERYEARHREFVDRSQESSAA